MKGFGGGMQQLMKQANQMQLRVQKLQEDFAKREFETTSGGGAVKVTLIGESQLKSIQISSEVFSEGDAELLQDMIVSATNEVLQQSKEEYKKETDKITGGMNLPGMI